MTVRTSKKASLTIEAALVLPVFLTGLLALVSLLLMWLTAQRVQASLLNTAEHLAVLCADGNNISLPEVRDELADSLSDEDYLFIENGYDGIDVSGSMIDDPEYIYISVRCRLVPLTGSLGIIGVPFRRNCLAHIWCGYENGFFPDGEYVYITDDSEVYHRDRECSHIRLTVNTATYDELPNLRNNDGSRYKPCEFCKDHPPDGTIYVTPEGTKYHKSLTCSGLKRTVRAIRITETGDRRPCSRCGR